MSDMKIDFPRLKVSPEIKRKMVEVARQFRKEPTKSEAILWQALRGKKLDGIKFRRQQPVGNFVVDFYNSTYRLVVEIDGSVHNEQIEYDQARQDVLEELGLNVLRLKSDLIEKNLPSGLMKIRKKIEELKANEFPSPFIGEGLGEREDTNE
ncbi:MAG TPA: DUF559 domain-containing protein [Anaerolineales bacterium]|nr:DUF559 domain-containing protein [Anaerolineales bacterium]